MQNNDVVVWGEFDSLNIERRNLRGEAIAQSIFPGKFEIIDTRYLYSAKLHGNTVLCVYSIEEITTDRVGK